jgi:hypothetical protein
MRLTFTIAASCIACGIVAAPVSAKPLDGSTSIREVKVLRPTKGAERGSLVVWVRVRHAGLTEAGRHDAVAGAANRGKVTVRIPGLGRRTATRELRADGGERGYTVRFAGAKVSDAVQVNVAATQTLDLDGDGTPEATTSDNAVQQNVTPTPVPQTIAPRDGTYGLPNQASVNGFDVQNGEVAVFWVTSTVGCVNDVVPYAPINPITGAFSFDYKGVKASGTFDANDTATADVSWHGVMGAGGPKCTGALPDNSVYSFFSP